MAYTTDELEKISSPAFDNQDFVDWINAYVKPGLCLDACAREAIDSLEEKGHWELGGRYTISGNLEIYHDGLFYMNPHTGSVGTYCDWFYETDDGDIVNAVDAGEVIRVTKTDGGDWIEFDA